MRRVVLIHNPQSSHAIDVKKQVIAPVKQFASSGEFLEYKIKPTSFNQNVRKITKILREQDRVVVAGGDGTATIVANAILATEHSNISLIVLGYGNFNDMSTGFGAKGRDVVDLLESPSTVKAYPLEVLVNNSHFRYSVCYFNLGLFAEVVRLFDKKEHRKELQTGKKGVFFSWRILTSMYLKAKKTPHLPEYRLNGNVMNTTDYVAINNTVMAQILKSGKRFYLGKEFAHFTPNLSKFTSLISAAAPSLFGRMPCKTTTSDELVFEKPTDIASQSEGEYCKLKTVRKIKIVKSKKYLNVVTVD
jgi:Sphingosine kinase and enzymes related to eukaryotic diacylglycerol kinase